MKPIILDDSNRNAEIEQLLGRQGEIAQKLLDLTEKFMKTADGVEVANVEEFLDSRALRIKEMKKNDSDRQALVIEASEPFEMNARMKLQMDDMKSALSAITNLDSQLSRFLHQAQMRAINNMAFASNYVNFGNISDAGQYPAKRIVDLKR